MVLARPTIRGQAHSGLNPTVAPGKRRKSSASEIVLVSSRARRSRARGEDIASSKWRSQHCARARLFCKFCSKERFHTPNLRISMINFRLVRHLWLFLAVAEEQH